MSFSVKVMPQWVEAWLQKGTKWKHDVEMGNVEIKAN